MNDQNKTIEDLIYECLSNFGFRGLDGQALVMHMQSYHYDSVQIRKALVGMVQEGILVYVPSGRYKTKKSINEKYESKTT